MLKSLLGIVLLTSSNSVATFQQQPKTQQNFISIQEANSESVNDNNTINYALQLDRINEYNDTRAGSKTQKVTFNAYNSFLLASAEVLKYQVYANADSTDTDNSKAIVINDHTTDTDDNYYSQSVMMLQITPYLHNADSNIDIQLVLSLATNYTTDYQNVPIDYAYTNVQLFGTTDNLNSYIGTSNWANNGYVNSIIEELQDPQFGYTYYYTEQNTTNLTNNNNNRRDLNFNVSIVPNTINYFFIFSTTHVYSTEEFTNRVKIATYHNDYQNQLSGATITGTGIIPAESTEVVDIPGMMFQILGMPFYFISTAFNLTLFPGTQYQLNISSLFLAIIAVFIFIFLLRLILKVGK